MSNVSCSILSSSIFQLVFSRTRPNNNNCLRFYQYRLFVLIYFIYPLACSPIYRYLKAALLPNSQQSLRTSLVSGALLKPVFGNSFAVAIPLNKLYTKTLQVNVLSVVGQREEIVVSFTLLLL